MEEYVILVDENDRQTGVMEKLKAHREARLHRAISVFVFNDRQELLLQQRSASKYHSPLLWTNTCCSHPRPGEAAAEAAQRRLKEEMSLDCRLSHRFTFIYKADLDQGLTEYEFDHIFFGRTNVMPLPDPLEAAGWRYAGLDEIDADIQENPAKYTAWLMLMMEKIKIESNEHID